jgi:hypothetical protein
MATGRNAVESISALHRAVGHRRHMREVTAREANLYAGDGQGGRLFICHQHFAVDAEGHGPGAEHAALRIDVIGEGEAGRARDVVERFRGRQRITEARARANAVESVRAVRVGRSRQLHSADVFFQRDAGSLNTLRVVPVFDNSHSVVSERASYHDGVVVGFQLDVVVIYIDRQHGRLPIQP